MLIVRLVAYLALVAIGVSFVTFLLTRDRRYVRLAWQIFKYGLIFALIVLAVLALERIVLVPL